MHQRARQGMALTDNSEKYSLYPRVGSTSEHRRLHDPRRTPEPVATARAAEYSEVSGRMRIENEPLMDDRSASAFTNPPMLDDDNASTIDGRSTMPSIVSFGGQSANHPRRPLRSAEHHPSVVLAGHTSTDSSVSASMMRSMGSSAASHTSTAPTEPILLPLQVGPLDAVTDQIPPVSTDDPANFDLVEAAPPEGREAYVLEDRVDKIMSEAHLREIFDDQRLLLHFTSFLSAYRPQGLQLLMFYLDSLKALRSIGYANAIAEALEPPTGFGKPSIAQTTNWTLEQQSDKAFEILAKDDLVAYVAHIWINIVSEHVQKRVTGNLPPHLREASKGLAEVFCLTDPSRKDNPIVFMSEEFHRTTQYGTDYCVGRNCRLLQGPRTSKDATRRLREAVKAGKELSEVFLNYRRDGEPFLNLLLMAPLHDDRGNIRYFIGAQVDVSGLALECAGLDGMQRLLEKEFDAKQSRRPTPTPMKKDEFELLSEMFNSHELDIVRRHGGRMHQQQVNDDDDRQSIISNQARLIITDFTVPPSERKGSASSWSAGEALVANIKSSGRLSGVYEHYLLVRPAPSLRILFTSPSLRVPGILQTPLLSRIGGSARTRDDLVAALACGRSVTARVRWLTRPDAMDEVESRTRWLHCTPLLNHKQEIGVWMIILVDTDPIRTRFRAPPAVADNRDISEHHRNSIYAPARSSGRNGAPLVGRKHRPIEIAHLQENARRGAASEIERIDFEPRTKLRSVSPRDRTEYGTESVDDGRLSHKGSNKEFRF